jgi:hypothetical protein
MGYLPKAWKWSKRHSTVSNNYHSLGGVLFLANILKLIVTLQHYKTSYEEVHTNIDRPLSDVKWCRQLSTRHYITITSVMYNPDLSIPFLSAGSVLIWDA